MRISANKLWLSGFNIDSNCLEILKKNCRIGYPVKSSARCPIFEFECFN